VAELPLALWGDGQMVTAGNMQTIGQGQTNKVNALVNEFVKLNVAQW